MASTLRTAVPFWAIQLENEMPDDAEYLKKLKELAIKCGMEVPLYTVTGWNSTGGAKIPVDEVLPLFGGYCGAPWEQSTGGTSAIHSLLFHRNPE